MNRTPRISFSAATRRAVQAKTDGWCGICGCDLLEPDRFAVDHIIPIDRGGSNDVENLQPAHVRCNAMKSKRDLPEWSTPAIAATAHRPRGEVYDLAFPAPRYAEAMRRNGSSPFVEVGDAPDGGRFIGRMDQQQTFELLRHGACVTDAEGVRLATGVGARYFIWPHVAARGPRYNGGVYSLVCPARAELARFEQNRAKGEEVTLERVARAAELWLAKTPGCQWPCEAARQRLHGGADYEPGGAK